MTTTLKDCPFCGGVAEMDTRRAYRSLSSGHLGTAVSIYCCGCSADMMHCYEDNPGTDPEALWDDLRDQWNRRTSA